MLPFDPSIRDGSGVIARNLLFSCAVHGSRCLIRAMPRPEPDPVLYRPCRDIITGNLRACVCGHLPPAGTQDVVRDQLDPAIRPADGAARLTGHDVATHRWHLTCWLVRQCPMLLDRPPSRTKKESPGMTVIVTARLPRTCRWTCFFALCSSESMVGATHRRGEIACPPSNVMTYSRSVRSSGPSVHVPCTIWCPALAADACCSAGPTGLSTVLIGAPDWVPGRRSTPSLRREPGPMGRSTSPAALPVPCP